jgi:hypothetical protein
MTEDGRVAIVLALIQAVKYAIAVTIRVRHPAATHAHVHFADVRRTLINAVGHSVSISVSVGNAAPTPPQQVLIRVVGALVQAI